MGQAGEVGGDVRPRQKSDLARGEGRPGGPGGMTCHPSCHTAATVEGIFPPIFKLLTN